jgi:hypothetical protein
MRERVAWVRARDELLAVRETVAIAVFGPDLQHQPVEQVAYFGRAWLLHPVAGSSRFVT